MDVEIGRLRSEILLSQPALSPQDDSPPRRSPTVGKGLDEPKVPCAEMQSAKQEVFFPLQASLDVFLHVCTSPEQDTTFLLQADAGMDNAETTSQSISRCSPGVCKTTEEAAAAKGTAWDADQTKQFNPGG